MRFMLIVKANPDSEAGVMPTRELAEAMGRFNEEMFNAGVLLAGEGLQPTSRGARVRFGRDGVTVTDGPFSETKELVAGFWIIQAASLQEAIGWVKRAPAPHGPGKDAQIEVRQVYETSDFPADVFPPEAAAKEEMMRRELERTR